MQTHVYGLIFQVVLQSAHSLTFHVPLLTNSLDKYLYWDLH